MDSSGRTAESYRRTVVQVVDSLEDVGSRALGDVPEEVSNRVFRILPDVVHIFLYGLETIIIDDGLNESDALMVRRNLLLTPLLVELLKESQSRRTAFKSLSTSLILRHPELPGYCAGLSTMYSSNPFRSNTPSLTILNETISAPSSAKLVLVGGIDPGRIPPMSAWCPREAVKKMMFPVDL